jgi:hypothetical protein
MYNKKVLIDSLKNLGSAKAPVKRRDVLVDPSGNPLMSNGGLNEKPYKKVSVQKSNIQGKGLFADEPIRAGEIIGLSHIKSSFQKNGETYLKSKETPVVGAHYNHSDNAFNAGSIIEGNKRYLRALKNIQPGEEITGNYYEDNDPTLETPDNFQNKKKEGGALLTKKVTCKKCGWKWDAADGGDDVTTCHKCGGQGSVHARDGGESGPWNPDYEQPSTFEFKPLSPEEIEERERKIRLIEESPEYIKAKEAEAYNKALTKEPQYYDEGLQFIKGWHDSPMYNQMVLNSYQGNQKNADYTTRLRKKNIETIPGVNVKQSQAEETDGPIAASNTAAWSLSDTGQIEVFPGGFEYGPTLYVHEGLHSSDRPRELYKWDHPSYKDAEGNLQYPDWMLYEDPRFPNEVGVWHNRVIPVSDQRYISSHRGANYKDNQYYKNEVEKYPELYKMPTDEELKNTLIKSGWSETDDDFQTDFNKLKAEAQERIKDTKKIDKETWKETGHDYVSDPTEVRARLGEIRYNAKKEGIYDPFTEQITPEIFKQYINADRDSENWQPMKPIDELRLDFTDEEILWMLQNISKNNDSAKELDVAAEGGSLELELTPQEIEEYAKGGFIIEDISVPELTKANLGGVAKVASKITPGNALRASLYKGVNPANYNILEKFTGIPSELYNNNLNNSTRPFRTGMSLKFGAPEHLSQLINNLDVSKAQWDKFSEADKMMAIKDLDPELITKLEDIGRRRLDAWAVGLHQPQEYNTLEQIGDNTYKMLGLQHTPQFFAERRNDIIANGLKGQPWDDKRDKLVGLTKDFYDLSLHPMQRINPEDNRWAGLRRSQIDEFLGEPAYHHPWNQTFNVGKSPDSEFTDAIYDNDSYGVRGGYRWDVRDTPEGMQWKAYDKWDLNPFERRGSAFLNPSPIMNKYLHANYFKPLQNLEALSLVGGRPFNIENNFLIDPKTYKTIKQWRNGGPAPTESDPPMVEDIPEIAPINANSYFSNWYGNRQLPFDQIGNKSYERTLKQFLPVYNPESPLLEELNQSIPYEYTDMINNDPTAMGELVYDDDGEASKILLKESLKSDPKELNATIAHEERTRLWDKYGDKILPAEQIIIQPNLKSFEEGWGDLKGADKKAARDYYDYLTDPSQDNIQSLIFEVRQKKGLQPTQVITDEDIKSWKSEAEKNGALDKNNPNYDPALYNLFKVVKDDRGLKDLFNYIAKNDSQEEMQYAQQGGSIDYELGDEIDEATMKKLQKLGYTFEKI